MYVYSIHVYLHCMYTSNVNIHYIYIIYIYTNIYIRFICTLIIYIYGLKIHCVSRHMIHDTYIYIAKWCVYIYTFWYISVQRIPWVYNVCIYNIMYVYIVYIYIYNVFSRMYTYNVYRRKFRSQTSDFQTSILSAFS